MPLFESQAQTTPPVRRDMPQLASLTSDYKEYPLDDYYKPYQVIRENLKLYRDASTPADKQFYQDVIEYQIKARDQKYINHNLLPRSELEAFISSVNTSIEQYNRSDDITTKIALLKEIQHTVREMNEKYPQYFFADSPSYRKIEAQLFQEIQYQYQSLGQPSLLSSEKDHSMLEEILANMSPVKVDQLLSILIDTTTPTELKSRLNNLYKADELESDEAKRFQAFLNIHSIQFLDGSNSLIFKVTNLDTGGVEILKVENLLSKTKQNSADLRKKMPEIFTASSAERQATCMLAGAALTRNIYITEYCADSDLWDKRDQDKTDVQILDSACNYMEQMAKILLQIQEQGFMHPDAKLENWLVRDDKLVISDDKSIVRTENGCYSSSIPGNEFGGLIRTLNFEPPEIKNRAPEILADKVHAYLLGKNLYVYLSENEIDSDSGDAFDYSSPIFSTERGLALRKLIEGLVKPNPDDRMRMNDALGQLWVLNHPASEEAQKDPHKYFETIIQQLYKLQIGTAEPEMIKFIKSQRERIREARKDQWQNIRQELEQAYSNLKNNPGLNHIKDLIKDFRKQDKFGMKDKADRIENALAKIPVLQRVNFLQNNPRTKEEKEVLKALASHRFWGGRVHPTEDAIDEKKAAKSFKDFKDKHADLFLNQENEQKEEHFVSPGSTK